MGYCQCLKKSKVYNILLQTLYFLDKLRLDSQPNLEVYGMVDLFRVYVLDRVAPLPDAEYTCQLNPAFL